MHIKNESKHPVISQREHKISLSKHHSAIIIASLNKNNFPSVKLLFPLTFRGNANPTPSNIKLESFILLFSFNILQPKFKFSFVRTGGFLLCVRYIREFTQRNLNITIENFHFRIVFQLLLCMWVS